MSAGAGLARAEAAHAPVMLAEVLDALAPENGARGGWDGVWLDGTLGAGGYARGVLDRGAGRVIAIDRDPEAIARAESWRAPYGDRLTLVTGAFGDLDRHAADAGVGGQGLAGVVLDIGVSSMQIDQGARGFSFLRDGPLDMRMAQAGPSAADLVNRADETDIADILFRYGEERASRRIARAIVAARRAAPIETTLQLAGIVERCLPRPRPGQPHAATRSFQALRIAVNDELGELARALSAAERALAPGGALVVVSFHSLEDRMVKRFMQLRSDAAPAGSRHAPEAARAAPRFRQDRRRSLSAGEAELAVNPRARSARLRAARRTGAAAGEPADPRALGAPRLDLETLMRKVSR